MQQVKRSFACLCFQVCLQAGKRLDFVSGLLPSSEVAGFGGKDFMLPHPLCSFYYRHVGLRNRRLAPSACRNDVRCEGEWEWLNMVYNPGSMNRPDHNLFLGNQCHWKIYQSVWSSTCSLLTLSRAYSQNFLEKFNFQLITKTNYGKQETGTQINFSAWDHHCLYYWTLLFDVMLLPPPEMKCRGTELHVPTVNRISSSWLAKPS